MDFHEDTFKNRLILVSNREPYIHEKTIRGIRCKQAIGGLVSALDPVMQSYKGTWVAWGSGGADREVCDDEDRVEVPPDNPQYKLKRVWLSEREKNYYYRGFCNRVLWPLSHLFLGKVSFEEKYWKAYKKVNAKFTKAVFQEATSQDVIWVHDYHLSLVPSLIKKDRSDSIVTYFWHIPWPPWEVYRILPWRREILGSLLCSDLIGFHTQRYVKNFKVCAEKEFDASVNNDTITVGDHDTTVKAFPLGIDYKKFNSISSSKKAAIAARRLRGKLHANTLILGVDRLDYTKGILDRLAAFERFLEKYPRYREKVVFVQIATPSRTKVKEYRLLKREVDEMVGRINGRFQRLDWVPIRYFYRSFTHEQLIAYYRAADIAFVTPLIDGMNLVAKEYMASKGTEDGVLILSEFAGAAEEMTEALLINPHDTRGVVYAIKKALEMSSRERKSRSEALRNKIRTHDLDWWLDSFFSEVIKVQDNPHG
ncbi:MAG: trehalose-6-phosphate synthase [Candidatus Hydrothermarchaeales archaeon]